MSGIPLANTCQKVKGHFMDDVYNNLLHIHESITSVFIILNYTTKYKDFLRYFVGLGPGPGTEVPERARLIGSANKKGKCVRRFATRTSFLSAGMSPEKLRFYVSVERGSPGGLSLEFCRNASRNFRNFRSYSRGDVFSDRNNSIDSCLLASLLPSDYHRNLREHFKPVGVTCRKKKNSILLKRSYKKSAFVRLEKF